MEEGCTIDGKFHNLEVENLLTAGEFKISDSIALTDITLQESIDIGTSATIGTDLTVDTNTLVVNSTNNNVGIGVDQPISTLKLDVSGNVRINGDLQVIGTTTSTTEEATSLSASLQQLGTGITGEPSNDSGIVIERGNKPNVFMGWDESEDKFIMGIAPNASNENITADSSGDLTLIKQDLQVSGIIAENLTGTITPDSASQPNITGVGIITSGTWKGTTIDDNYISSSATWNDKQDALTFGISDGNVIKCGTGIADDDFLRVNGTTLEGISSSELKTDIGLDNVENTALSEWIGSTSITKLGTITTGIWYGTAIPIAHGGTGSTTASGAATALGLGTGDSPQFTSIKLGHESDTVITRDTAGVVSISGNEVRTGTVPANKGGTGETSYTSGKLLIGNSSGGLTSSTLTPGSGISIINGDLGSITISADASEFIGLTDTPNSYTSYEKNIIQVNSAADGLEFTKSPELSTIGLRVSGTDNQFTVGVDNNDSNKFKIGTTAIDTNPRLTIDSAGNVGIGNSSPGHLLDVAGDINLTGDLKVNGSNAVFSNWTASTNGTDIYRDSNVGIGVTDPIEKLEVDGNIKGTNFIGNVNGTLNNYDSSRFFRREGRTNASTDIGPGWISVASCNGGRYAGEILVTDSRSVSHSYIRIHWLRSYGDSNFTVINCGGFLNRITGVRVLRQNSSSVTDYDNIHYGGKILQVYVGALSNYSVSVFRMGDDPHYGTFTALTPVVENDKTDYVTNGDELTDLSTYGFAHEQGILAGGPINAKQYNIIGTPLLTQFYTLTNSGSQFSANNWLLFIENNNNISIYGMKAIVNMKAYGYSISSSNRYEVSTTMTFSIWAKTSTDNSTEYSADPTQSNSTNRGEASVSITGRYSGDIALFSNASIIYAGQAFGVKCNYMNPNNFDNGILMKLYFYQV